jgi:hypothetical protein
MWMPRIAITTTSATARITRTPVYSASMASLPPTLSDELCRVLPRRA